MRIHQKEQQAPFVHQYRLSLLVAVIVVMSCILVLRLAYLQLPEYKRYATLSIKNQMNITPIAPSRGIILDRNGISLADNIPVFALEVIPERAPNLTKTLSRLKKLIPSITDDDLKGFERSRKQYRSYTAIPLKLKLSEEDVAIFSSNQHQFPGVSIRARLMRYYPLGDVTAHILGYVGRINARELKQVSTKNYRATTFIGKSGIERFYEKELHGDIGYQLIETDVSGRTLRILNKQNPKPGSTLQLTIDANLQRAAHHAMKGRRGAIVVMSTNNGEVLAMTSSPSYDPNQFVKGISSKDYQKLIQAKDNPLFNRAVRGLYPPASTVKPFLALMALDQKVITPSSKIYDPGWYRLPGVSHKYRDWKRRGHGHINLKKAITVSCDTYFYQLGNKMGISAIEDTLMKFGIGQRAHIDLFEETSGIIPSPNWKKRTKGVPWYSGDTLITAIGQGFTLASPLQLANATVAMSTHGKRYRPHLLLKQSLSNEQDKRYKPFEEFPVQLRSKNHWSTISTAMQSVISDRKGTGHRFGRDADYTVAAKTGTAQVYSSGQYEKKHYSETPEFLRDHSLFIAFAPVKNPEIAIAVIVENDYIASSIARKVMDSYFKNTKKT